MLHRDHVLAAALRPADRPAGLAGEPRHENRLDAETLRAEPTADVRGDDAHTVVIEAEKEAQDVTVEVWGLRREPQGRASVFTDRRDAAT